MAPRLSAASPPFDTKRAIALRLWRANCGIGATVEEHEDGLRIVPGPLHGATVDTYDDHRMAMSLALVGLAVPGVIIENPGCTAKTYPAFFHDWPSWPAGRVKAAPDRRHGVVGATAGLSSSATPCGGSTLLDKPAVARQGRRITPEWRSYKRPHRPKITAHCGAAPDWTFRWATDLSNSSARISKALPRSTNPSRAAWVHGHEPPVAVLADKPSA